MIKDLFLRMKRFYVFLFIPFFIFSIFEFRFLFEKHFYQKFYSFGFFDLWTIWHIYIFAFLILFRDKIKYYYFFYLLPIFILFSHSNVSPVTQSSFYYSISFFILPALFVLVLKRFNFIKYHLFFSWILLLMNLWILGSSIFGVEVFGYFSRLTFPYMDPLNTSLPTSSNWLAFLYASLIGLALSFDRTKAVKFKYLIILFSIIPLLLTQSYGAILSLLLACVFYLFKSYPKYFIKAFISSFVVFLLSLPFLYNTRKFQILIGNEVEYSSIDRRFQIYMVSWNIFLENPILGIGINNFQNIFRDVQFKYLDDILPEEELPPHPHNLFLYLILDFGLLGFLFYFYLIYKFLFTDSNIAYYYIFIHSLIDVPFATLEHSVLWFLALLF